MNTPAVIKQRPHFRIRSLHVILTEHSQRDDTDDKAQTDFGQAMASSSRRETAITKTNLAPTPIAITRRILWARAAAVNASAP
jgi:hypothetical protein